MIKRIIACLTICLIITGLISPVFSDASALPQPNWNDPGISEIINISDLTGWMLNGGTYDVSTYTDAESFMNDYYTARTKTRLEGSDYQVKSYFGLEQQYYDSGDSAYAHDLDINRVMSSSFRDHTGYGRRFSEQVNEALLGSGHLYDTKIPLLNEIEFANFVGYNHDALKLYSQSFVVDRPTVNPPIEYYFITNINSIWSLGHNFIGYNGLFSSSTSSYVRTDSRDTSSVSYISNDFTSAHNNIQNGSFTVIGLSPIVTINIDTSNQSSVYCTYSNYSYIGMHPAISHPYWFYSWLSNLDMFYQEGKDASYFPGAPYIQTSFSDLNSCINYIYQHYANVNIYVNGEAWALVNNNSTTLTPEFPDAVGGEDLPNTTWPISRPRAPYYTSVPGMLQAIEDAIADDGKLDIDDLKPYLTDENGDPVPDPIFDPEPVPIPVPDPVNPDVVPSLPELPVIPLDMPGYNGVSVLAEIINFTNQSLPTSLIVTFWGIVFGIVILGLIKILHK